MPEFTQASNQKRSLAIEILRSGCSVRLRAWGTSMLPVIWPGDLLHIEGVCGDPDIGDIVLVDREERFFVHRAIGRAGDRWMVRGDALRRPDPPVIASQLLGRVTMISSSQDDCRLPRGLSRLNRLSGLLLGEFNLLRSLVLRLYARKRRAGLSDWPAVDSPGESVV